MNVNVKVALTDEQRNVMYRNLTGKDVKRMVSRREVNDFVQGCIDAVLQPGSTAKLLARDLSEVECRILAARGPGEVRAPQRSLLEIDPEDAEWLADKSPSYIRGWNQVKRRKNYAGR